ncbi:MAG TPA: histidine phosphatase family protein [Longimicrobiales bacterium]
MLTLTLVRHAATALNATRRYQGHVDPPLSREGESQARGLAAVLGPALSTGAPAGPAGYGDAPGSDGRSTRRAAPGGVPAVHTPVRVTLPRTPTAAHRTPGADPGRTPETSTGRRVRTPTVYTSDLRRARRTAALALPGIRAIPEPRLRELDFGAFDGRSYDENLAAFGDAFRAWIADPARVPPPGGERLDELEARVLDWLAGLPRDGHVIAFTHGGPIRVILAHLRGVPFTATPHTPVAPGGMIEFAIPGGATDLSRETAIPAIMAIGDESKIRDQVPDFRFVPAGHAGDLPGPLQPDGRTPVDPDSVGARRAGATGGTNDAIPRPDPSRR